MSGETNLDETINHLEQRARSYLDTADPVDPDVVRALVRDWFDAIMARRGVSA